MKDNFPFPSPEELPCRHSLSESMVKKVKKFNTAGLCNPAIHYMVNLDARLKEIKKMVDAGAYFTINRARQYGKTTTLSALRKYLAHEYDVVSISFESIGNAGFEDEQSFVKAFCRILLREKLTGVQYAPPVENNFQDILERTDHLAKLDELTDVFLLWCASAAKPIVLMIDEVDSATNNQVFLDFLGQLRNGYLNRADKGIPAFHSVILAGVTDVKHLKAKIRPDAEHKVNSPWNIATDFTIDMSLSADGIQGMLDEYETDHHTGMNTKSLSLYIEKYTSGYPYLVSRICELIDTSLIPVKFTSLSEAWTEAGVDETIKLLLADGDNPLFGSLMGKLEHCPSLKSQLRRILMQGDTISWNPFDSEQAQLRMYGFIRNNNNTVAISNRIFEMLLYQYFLLETSKNDAFRQDALLMRPKFINDDHSLNMPLILEHFVKTQRQIHQGEDEHFLENEGRERFLTYIAPIINGTGTFSIEEQTRDQLRMDVVIHYAGHRYIVELKIWRGERVHEEGEKQIMAYLDRFGLTTGYMVSFNFTQHKKNAVERVMFGDKVLFEATV